MISPETIEKVKDAAQVHEIAMACGLELKKTSQGFEALCPFHKDDSPSFKIKTSENFYKCFGCGKAGDSLDFVQAYKKTDFVQAVTFIANHYQIQMDTSNTPQNNANKAYVKPVFKNHTPLSDAMVKWFKEKRGISQPTLLAMKVTQSDQWMYEVKKKKKLADGKEEIKIHPAGMRACINFNYFRDNELVNIKFRDHLKCFNLVKDAELIFYNLDSLKGAKTAWITEGEIDTITLAECGITGQGIAAVSVPNGANVKSNNMTYVDNCIHLFDNIEKIIIATDNDIAGRKLREDLSERFGKERCFYIEYKDNKKDINDVLISYGPKGVHECCTDLKEFPLVGAFAPSTFSDEIDDMYINGLDKGIEIGFGSFDKHIRFVKGYITTITGIPGMGKSDLLDMITMKLAVNAGWKGAFYSPENKPTKLHFSKLARKLIGKNWLGQKKMNELEKNDAKRFLEGRVWWIKPEKDFTLDSILDTIKNLKIRRGIDYFCLDAWNRLEHKYGGGMSETKYINESLTKLDTFCEMNNLHCFLVAHPHKMLRDKKTGKYEVPTLYNISGAAHFFNVTANGLCVYRNYDTGIVDVHIQKIKFAHWGSLGKIEYKYDMESGRYNEWVGGNAIEDRHNWISSTQKQGEMQIPEPPIYTDDGSEPPF